MPAKSIQFEDGTVVAIEDRETVRYTHDDKVALVWVDYEPGFFSRGRVIKLSSIQSWKDSGAQGDVTREIIDSDKEKIVERVKEYLRGTPVRVEDDSPKN